MGDMFLTILRTRSPDCGTSEENIFNLKNYLGFWVSYLRNVGVKLSIERVPLLLQLLQPGLCFLEALLTLPERVHELISLIQHRHHEVLEVGILTRELGAPLADAVLNDGRHHVTHHVPHFVLGLKHSIKTFFSTRHRHHFDWREPFSSIRVASLAEPSTLPGGLGLSNRYPVPRRRVIFSVLKTASAKSPCDALSALGILCPLGHRGTSSSSPIFLVWFAGWKNFIKYSRLLFSSALINS